MDFSIIVESLAPFSLAISVFLGCVAGWLAHYSKNMFQLFILLTIVWVWWMTRGNFPTVHLNAESVMAFPSGLAEALGEEATELCFSTLFGFAFGVITAWFAKRFLIHETVERRRDKQLRVYKSFAYEDDLSRALQANRGTSDCVIPWVNDPPEGNGSPTRASGSSDLRGFLSRADNS